MTNLWAWQQQRFPLALFLPAAGLLTLASVVGLTLPPAELGIRFVLALVLLLAFRLWDDLMDRDSDSIRYPDRLLPRVEPGPFWGVTTVAFGGAFLGVSRSWVSVGALVAGIAVCSAYYRFRPAWWVLLLKYPLMVLVLRGSLDRLGVPAMVLILAVMALDERLQPEPLGRVGLMLLTAVVLFSL